jgi:hypothetical protein
MKRAISARRTLAHRRLRTGSGQGLESSSTHGAQLQPLQGLLDTLRPGLSGYYPDWEGVKAAGPLAIAALCQQSTTFDVDNPYYQPLESLRSPTLQAHQRGAIIESINPSNPAGRILLPGIASDRVVPIAGFSPLDSGEDSGHNPSQGHSGMSSQAESFGTSEVSISFGTDRLRAGAGACELICDQSAQFELGCLLLSKAKQCQVSSANGSSSGLTS